MGVLAAILFFHHFSILQAAGAPIAPLRSAEDQAKALGAQLGLNVEVARDLRQQPVLSMPRGAQPMVMLRGIALALHASLVKEGSILTIVRTKADQIASVALDRKLMVERIRTRIAQWDTETPQSIPISGMAARVARAIHSDAVAHGTPSGIPGVGTPRGVDPALLSPAGRLLRGLVGLIDLHELANVEPSGSRIYSNIPTPMEVELRGTEGLLKQFAEEQKSYAVDPALRASEQDLRLSRDSFEMPPANLELQGLKIVLTIRRLGMDMFFGVSIYNADGKTIAWAGTFTWPTRDNVTPGQRSAIAASKHAESVVELGSEQNAFEGAIAHPPVPLMPTDNVWQRVLHPGGYDPANILVPTALRPWLESDGKPIVAVIPDDLIDAAQFSVKGAKLNVAAFEALIPDSCEELESEGIRILRPSDPICSDFNACDRVVLGSALRSMVSSGRIDLRTWSRLLFEGGNFFSAGARRYVSIVRSSAKPEEFVDINTLEDVFQVVGTLPEEAWNALDSGSQVQTSDETFRSKLWQYVLQHASDLLPGTDLPEIDHHATELFPDGLPRDTKMVVRPLTMLTFRPVTKPEQPKGIDEDWDDWAQSLHRIVEMREEAASRAGPAAEQMRETNARIYGTGRAALDNLVAHATYVPCVRPSVEVVIDLPRGIRLYWVLRGITREVGPASGFAEMPKAYRDAAYAEWDKLEHKNSLAPPGG